MPLKKPNPGDDLLRIAQAQGVSTQQILTCQENRDLFACSDPGVLFTADEIWIPEPEPKKLRVGVGNTTYLVYRPAQRTLHLALRDEQGAPMQVDYTLQDFEYDGTEKDKLPPQLYGFAYQGIVHEVLPAAVTKLKLVLDDDEENALTLELGRLEPVSTTRGLKARLSSLGLFVGELDGSGFDPELRLAVERFQRIYGVPVTGAADPATREKLKTVCGG